jgi:hypothetical protein
MNSTSYNPIAPSHGVKEMLTTRNKDLNLETIMNRPQLETKINNGHMSDFTRTSGLNSFGENRYDISEIMQNKYY